MSKSSIKVAILGAGSLGTALAEYLSGSSLTPALEVYLWGRNVAKQKASGVAFSRLGLKVHLLADLQLVLTSADVLLLCVPSTAVRAVLSEVRLLLPVYGRGAAGAPAIIIAAKGLENHTLLSMFEVALEVLGSEFASKLLALSGPSFAAEIVRGEATVVALASPNMLLAEQIAQQLFKRHLRAYATTDVKGVELGGALKNVIAIALGIASGLGLGENTKAVLLTQGLCEIRRIAVAEGAEPLTLMGLAGVGDLFLTCTSSLSRNRTLGRLLGEGLSLNAALKQIKQVVEGIETTAAAYALSRRIEKRQAPQLLHTEIIDTMYAILYGEAKVASSFKQLLESFAATSFV